ncbi:MAG: zinc ribbon domain-containing protein [Acidobacteriota bacterium]
MARKTTTTGSAGGTRRPGAPAPLPPPPAPAAEGGIHPWHLLVLGVLVAASAGAVATREGGTVQTVAVTVTVLTAGLAAAGMARTLGPLVAVDAGEETDMLAGRTRAALEREKMLVLRSIKEVEFDRAMHKISEADYNEIVPRLRVRAVGLIRQLEGGGGYRGLIERDLAALMGTPAAGTAKPEVATPVTMAAPAVETQSASAAVAGTCPSCAIVNDSDARFCKSCGARLSEAV